MLTKNICTVLLGPTQAGKSSVIAILMPADDPSAPVVSRPSAGKSVTETCQAFHTEIGLVMDSPGYDDTDRDVEINEFTHQTASIAFQSDGIRFVIVDSLANDSICLRETKKILDKAFLDKSFGKDAGTGVVVLATKKEKLDENELEERIDNMKEVLASNGLPNCAVIPW